MSTPTFFRISGWAAVLSGVLGVIIAVLRLIDRLDLAPEWLRSAISIATLISLVGIYLYQKEPAGTFGLIAFLVIFAGAILVWIEANIMLDLGVYTLGLILLGIAVLRAGVFPKWIAWMWIVGPFTGAPTLFLPEAQRPIFVLAGSVFFAAGFIGAGLQLIRMRT